MTGLGVVRVLFGRRGAWLVLAFWIAVSAAAVPLSSKLTGVQRNDAAAWLPAGAESTRVVAWQERHLAGETVPVLVVYERTAGITEADRAAVASHARQFAALAGVRGEVLGPVPAADGQAVQVVVPVDASGGWDPMRDVVHDVRAVAGIGGGGLTVAVTGPAAVNADLADVFADIDGRLLYGALAVVVVLLLLVYRSPVLWLLPVVGALVALTVAQAAVYLLVEHAGVIVNAQSAGILLVLVFGAATDYALLLIARYREELRRHADRNEAMAVALVRVGPAVIASAATVAAGMLCLLAAQMNSTRGMGPVAAVGVAIAVAAMLTLLPALLVVAGRWVFWPRIPRAAAEPADAAAVSGPWARAGERIATRPRLTWAVTAAALGALALGLLHLDPGVIQGRDAFVEAPASIAGEEVLARHFPQGSGSPVAVVADAAATGAVRDALARTPGVAAVGQPRTFDRRVYLEATLAAPPDSPAAQATVDRVRAAVHAIPGAGALVGGATAVNLDAERAAGRDNARVMPLVLLAVLAVLALLLRAVVAPVVLLATVVLSFAAALGASTLVFAHVLGFAGPDPAFPLLVFVFLVALGIDYNIFLVTAVREQVPRHGTRRATVLGLATTGAVITSAGLVLAGTFAVLATLPVVNSTQIGIAVAFGVLLDTLVVRSILVTALSLDIGRWMWWPGRLAAAGRPVVRVPGGPA
jgi:RND superfamily putative drug exporter